MTKPDQRKLRFLITLLAVLGLTVFVGYRRNRPPAPVIVEAEGLQPKVAPSAQSGAKIRLDLLDRQREASEVGISNLFTYRSNSAAPVPPKPTAAAPSPPLANPQPKYDSPPRPPVPAPPPPIPLRYIGYAFVEPNSKALIATLIDDAQNHFNAFEGDVWMGRYRVLRVSDASVEVEDLEFNRRQTLQLVKQ